MNSTTNQDLVSRRRRQAFGVSALGIVVLLLGLFLNLRGSFQGAYIALILGTMASWTGVVLSDRWVAVPRPDKVLAEALQRCSGRLFHLFNWTLPPDHVLLAPWGLTILHTVGHDGPAGIDGKRWRDLRPIWRRLLRFAKRPVRYPGPLINLDTQALRALLVQRDPSFESVPIDALAVFTHPQARLSMGQQDPELPVLRAAELDDWAKEAIRQRPRLAPAVRLRLEEVFKDLRSR